MLKAVLPVALVFLAFVLIEFFFFDLYTWLMPDITCPPAVINDPWCK